MAGAADGLRWGRLWVLAVGVVVVAVMERYPVAVSPGDSGRRYQDVTELGIGLQLLQTSPAALGVAVALGHVPLALRWELPIWKRAFGIGQAVLAAVLAGVVYGLLDDVEPRAWAVVATGATVTVVLAVPLVAMASERQLSGTRRP